MATSGGSALLEEGSGGRPPHHPEEAAAAPSTSGAAAAAFPSSGRETVLGNCARCGSADRLKFCSRCNAVRYCSPDCQQADVRGRGEGEGEEGRVSFVVTSVASCGVSGYSWG